MGLLQVPIHWPWLANTAVAFAISAIYEVPEPWPWDISIEALAASALTWATLVFFGPVTGRATTIFLTYD